MTVWSRVAAVGIAVALGCGDRGGDPVVPETAPQPPTAGCRPGEMSASVRAQERTIEVDGVPRTYVLDVPMGATDEPRPMLLAFHGFGARGRRLRRWSMLGRMGHRRGVIVVFPDGADGVEGAGRTGRGWRVDLGGSPDVAFVRALLDRLEQDWCVDRDRVGKFFRGFTQQFPDGDIAQFAVGLRGEQRFGELNVVHAVTSLDDPWNVDLETARNFTFLVVHRNQAGFCLANLAVGADDLERRGGFEIRIVESYQCNAALLERRPRA